MENVDAGGPAVPVALRFRSIEKPLVGTGVRRVPIGTVMSPGGPVVARTPPDSNHPCMRSPVGERRKPFLST